MLYNTLVLHEPSFDMKLIALLHSQLNVFAKYPALYDVIRPLVDVCPESLDIPDSYGRTARQVWLDLEEENQQSYDCPDVSIIQNFLVR